MFCDCGEVIKDTEGGVKFELKKCHKCVGLVRFKPIIQVQKSQSVYLIRAQLISGDSVVFRINSERRYKRTVNKYFKSSVIKWVEPNSLTALVDDIF